MVAHTHRSIHPFTQIVYALLNSSATAVHIIVPLHHQPLSTSSSSYRRASCNIICLSIYIQIRSMEEACAEKMMELQMNDSTSYECKTTVSKLVVCDSVRRCSNAGILCVCVCGVCTFGTAIARRYEDTHRLSSAAMNNKPTIWHMPPNLLMLQQQQWTSEYISKHVARNLICSDRFIRRRFNRSLPNEYIYSTNRILLQLWTSNQG